MCETAIQIYAAPSDKNKATVPPVFMILITVSELSQTLSSYPACAAGRWGPSEVMRAKAVRVGEMSECRAYINERWSLDALDISDDNGGQQPFVVYARVKCRVGKARR